MSASLPSFLEEGIRLVLACPLCKAEDEVEVHVVEQADSKGVVHSTCNVCQHALLTHIERHDDVGVSAVGMITDLSRADLEALYRASAIELDDVLKTHQELESGAFLERLLQESNTTTKKRTLRRAS